jgi:hypothetical protein
VNDKKNMTATPGWMWYMRLDEGRDFPFAKTFRSDGSIREGFMSISGGFYSGFRWELKDDKTHDKFKMN